MKQSLLLSLFLMLYLGLQGQNFSPVGAEWTLGFKTFGLYFDLETDIRSIHVPEEQMKAGKLCRVMVGNVWPTSPSQSDSNFVYNDSGAVYAWYKGVGMFQKVYDFNATVGDSWNIYVDQIPWAADTMLIDTMSITVDSVFNEVIDGVTSQSYLYSVVHHMNANTDQGCIDMGLEYFASGEKANSILGSGFFMFPVPTALCLTDIYGLPFLGRAQTCYTDDDITYTDLNGEPFCDYQNVGLSDVVNSVVQTRVNYTSLQIELMNSNKPTDISIYDISGKLLRHKKNSMYIDIAGLNSGIYILKMVGEKGIETQKIKL